jgi:dihydroneopterin aldolase
MKKLLVSLLFLALTAAAQISSDGVSNSFIGAIEAIGGRTVQVNLNISYPSTASPEDYVDVSLLRPDTSAVIASVENKSAPLERFAAAIAQAILDKYPQMQSVGVQIFFAPNQATQQTVQAFRTRPPKAVDPATAAKKQ